MLRTNSKKYLSNIQNYLLDAINTDDHTTEATTHAEKLAFVMSCYESEFNHRFNQARHPNEQTRFAHWLAGLPSVLNIPFYNDDIVKLAKRLQEVDTYPNEKNTTKRIVENYFNFMAYHILKLNAKLNK
ncbi:MAG: hypothetical protein GY834_07590 [Bacteroidetes bacterium]|jgi:hypothetical protein|nr:hypothetical protein [Bacteroidota bacterium]